MPSFHPTGFAPARAASAVARMLVVLALMLEVVAGLFARAGRV